MKQICKFDQNFFILNVGDRAACVGHAAAAGTEHVVKPVLLCTKNQDLCTRLNTLFLLHTIPYLL